ncbi:polysaccharide deacetylase family protein [Actinomycetospora sp. TBRC 11914]|uniref:polysaccharide deacetylase family protein n=1 Tax=Actinomycetospora sp. TBRC 11914 TaxID=2729387 RepID=UPI00145CF39B|nr:polysaccharide deacetylase family protein [Actinomycetospora sp. TBRC 11914]NMO90366.1 polysaccharide deacetylase family protein [Actinomycetospora sp. TBRC 11914]
MTSLETNGRLRALRWTRRVLLAALAAVLTVLPALTGTAVAAPVGVASAQGAPAQGAAAAPTVVSLTFDDGNADQLGLLDTLEAHGLHGTFYIVTGAIGQPGYLTREGLARIAGAGDEIGGHTVLHPQLTGDDPAEVARQICDGRATLAQWGYHPVSFAYPYGVFDPAVEAAVRDCGYASARAAGGLGVAGPGCPNCRTAESVPPADPYAVRTAAQVTDSTTLADLEQSVVEAQSTGGGWVPFIFHHESCSVGCNGGDLSSTPALLDRFAAWLVGQQQQGRLVVRTVGQVVADPDGPIHSAPPSTRPDVANPTLTAGNATTPDCWQAGGYGTNTATYRRDPPAAGQSAAETITMTSWTDGDAVLLPRLDLGQCTAWTQPGLVVDAGASYRSTVPTQFAVYVRDGSGAWTYWTSSPWLDPSDTWRRASWTTPPTPPDTTGVAAGLIIGGVGTLSTTDYHVGPVVPPPPPAPLRTLPDLRQVLQVGGTGLVVLLIGSIIWLLRPRRRRRRGEPTDPGHGWGPPSTVDVPAPREGADPTGSNHVSRIDLKERALR